MSIRYRRDQYATRAYRNLVYAKQSVRAAPRPLYTVVLGYRTRAAADRKIKWFRFLARRSNVRKQYGLHNNKYSKQMFFWLSTVERDYNCNHLNC